MEEPKKDPRIDRLIFTALPTVRFASNTFVRVRTILQYEDTPLLFFTQAETAGFATEIPIYHQDGTYLAKAVGSRLITTPAGKKAGVVMSHPAGVTVCKLGNQVLFELHRHQAAALNAKAELYTPDGYFVRCSDGVGLFKASGSSLDVGGIMITGCTFQGCSIGVLVKNNGMIAVGVA